MADTINARHKVKRDTTAHWNSATGFVPLDGEIIVYTDYQVSEREVNIYDPSLNPIEQGAIGSSDGQDTSSGTRLRTRGYIPVSPSTEYKIDTDMARVFVLEYGFNWSGGAPTYLNVYSGWKDAPYTFTTSGSTLFIRIVLDNNNSSVTTSDFGWMTLVDPTQTVTTIIPGIKIGSGNAYVQDLAFIDEDTRRTLAEHIEDLDIHVTAEEKAFWNNKVNTEDTVVGETLVFTRT